MSFFRRKKEEIPAPAPTSGAYGNNSSYNDDYGADEYSSSAYGRSGGLQPGRSAGYGRSVSPSGYGSQQYGGRNRYDTPDDPTEYSSTTTAASRPNVLQKGNPSNRRAPAREEAEDDDYNSTAYKPQPSYSSRQQAPVDTGKRDLLFAGATVKPSERPANARSPSGYGNQDGEDDEFEDVESIKKATDRTRDETIQVLGNTLAQGRQALETAVHTNNRLREQGEQLGATGRHFIAAEDNIHQAGDNITRINELNRSIFIPAVGIHRKGKRKAQEEEEKMKRYEKQREKMEENYDFTRSQRGDRDPYGRDNIDGPDSYGRRGRNPMPDSDGEDTEKKEETINSMTRQLEELSLGLSQQVKQMGQRIDSHNKILRQQETHVDKLTGHVVTQTARANRIGR